MESKNHKVVKNFVTNEEINLVKDFIYSLSVSEQEIKNEHIREVHQELNGNTWIYDITETEISNYLSQFQSSQNVLDINTLPQIFLEIKERISETLEISSDNCFLQIISQKTGGRIKPHYDTGYPGYINYKCNVAIQSETDYDLIIENDKLNVNQSDLYCFEASLFKHWTEPFKNKRIILSYGFALKYQDLSRSDDDPRCRMSRRMSKYFQNLINV